jgi:hypothetical protein
MRMHATAHLIAGVQARSFTDDDVDAAEARLQVCSRTKYPARHSHQPAGLGIVIQG